MRKGFICAATALQEKLTGGQIWLQYGEMLTRTIITSNDRGAAVEARVELRDGAEKPLLVWRQRREACEDIFFTIKRLRKRVQEDLSQPRGEYGAWYQFSRQGE